MKLCSVVHDRKKNEPVCDEKGPIKFPVFIFKFLSTALEGWQMNLLCFLNGITQDFKYQSYRGVVAWGKWYGKLFIEITPGSTTIQLWPLGIRDWLIRQGRQLISEIKNDISWLKGER